MSLLVRGIPPVADQTGFLLRRYGCQALETADMSGAFEPLIGITDAFSPATFRIARVMAVIAMLTVLTMFAFFTFFTIIVSYFAVIVDDARNCPCPC